MVTALLSRLFGRAPIPVRPAQPRLPDGERLYAVGDVHGRCDLLERLLDQVRADAAEAPAGTRFTLLFLGDYVDRGPQSRNVLDLLCGDPWPGADKVFLRGNHDEMLRRFLVVPEGGRLWFDLGGAATLVSYGVDVDGRATEQEPAGADGRRHGSSDGAPGGATDGRGDWHVLAERLAAAVPEAHRHFLDATRLSHQAGDYLFVHAGVRPRLALERQDPEELMNIREPFLSEETGLAQVVVHGHTPVREPAVTPTRIAVDTGAYTSGRLTALVLEGAERRFLST